MAVTPYIRGQYPSIEGNDRKFFDNEFRKIQDCLTSVLQTFAINSYTVATLPAVTIAAPIIYVSNETGGATLAFTDGVNWRRVQDRAIVS